MSDTVLLALIAGTPGVVASILGFLNQVMIRRANAIGQSAVNIGKEAASIGKEAAMIGKQAAAMGAKAAELGAKNEQHLVETKNAMVTLEKNTNSIKDALVETTAIANRAIGNREGRAELKRETDGEPEEHSG